MLSINLFLQYLLMFAEDEAKQRRRGQQSYSLPGQERLGTGPLARRSIRQGRSRGASLSTRQTISQFLLPSAGVADDDIANAEDKKEVLLCVCVCGAGYRN